MLRGKAREHARISKGYIRRREDEAAESEMGLAVRFWKKVNKTETCWLWTGGICQGYGVYTENKKLKKAHRVMYEKAVAEIGEGLVIDHLCRVKHCVRPDHLEAVTDRMNILRGKGLAAGNCIKTSCKRGHVFSPENTYVKKVGKTTERCCRICMRNHYKAYRGRKNLKITSQMG